MCKMSGSVEWCERAICNLLEQVQHLQADVDALKKQVGKNRTVEIRQEQARADQVRKQYWDEQDHISGEEPEYDR